MEKQRPSFKLHCTLLDGTHAELTTSFARGLAMVATAWLPEYVM